MAVPDKCAELETPPTALFNLGHLYQEVISKGIPILVLIGCNTVSANQSASYSIFFGIELSIPFSIALLDLIASAVVKLSDKFILFQ